MTILAHRIWRIARHNPTVLVLSAKLVLEPLDPRFGSGAGA